MASTVAKGVMRNEALDRLNAASGALLGRAGIERTPYALTGNDPELAQIRLLAAIAGDLERLDAATAPKPEQKKGKAKE